MASLSEIVQYCNERLQVARYSDYCPNGLQVDGRPEVSRLVTGVTASQALLDAAVDAGADAVLVHHGYFWKGEAPALTGMKYRRISTLIRHDISLIAYHLPLDGHPQIGNNISLARRLGLTACTPGGDSMPHSIVFVGEFSEAMPAGALAALLGEKLARQPLWVSGGEQAVRRVAICTGGAQGYIGLAAELGADAFITGEASEQTTHIAREEGIHFFAAGHHATERYGVQALGEELAAKFSLQHQFIDVDNPV
ncbi:Nif3-like dinuclear metal center hexameric protein [Granulosicoccaceae sp. 1_MG-2023]|nr:Nif3-like dinuclear metal center hexameric protein [Granulosicoccaceae sp. 1_MG-2023]